MPKSLLPVTTMSPRASDTSGRRGAVAPQSALSRATPSPHQTTYAVGAKDTLSSAAPLRLLRGRVRWSKQRAILEWQTKEEATPGSFVAYRSQTMVWQEARPLDLSIFATHDSPPGCISYRAVDTTATPPGPYFYWLVKLTIKHAEHHFGPYIVHEENNLDFQG